MTTQAPARNGLGTGSVIVGIVAVALSWIPVVNYASLVLGVIGLALAMMGFARVRKGGADNPVTVAVGAIVSAAAVVVSIVAFANFVDEVEKSVPALDEPEIQRICEPPLDC